MGSNPIRNTTFGMDYGDSRVCKTLAGEFESHASHKKDIQYMIDYVITKYGNDYIKLYEKDLAN